jgi:hypothetical protein
MAQNTVQPASPAKSERSGRVSLYLSPELHSELVVLADALGLDLNGLLRMMIARTINHFRMEAHILMEEAQENLTLLSRWLEQNPGRPKREFLDEYWSHRQAKKQMRIVDALAGFNFGEVEEILARAGDATRNQSSAGGATR